MFPVVKENEPIKPSFQEWWDLLNSYCKKFAFNVEKTKEGKIHYQTAISLKTKEYESTVRNIFSPAHVESGKNYFALFNYSTKTETRIAGPFTEKKKPLKVIENLRPWQEDLKNELLLEPDDRKIIWYFDEKGGMGKTQFCKYMAVHHEALILQNGNCNDIGYACNDPKIVIFNLARSQQKFFNYTALENLKDGMIFSGKYESHMKIFNSPHVIVFSNWPPKWEEMTEDKWCLREV